MSTNTQLPQMSTSGTSEADAIMAEKKRKRTLRNREAARRSRMKKQKMLESLVGEVGYWKQEIRKNTDKYDFLVQKMASLESENNFLKAQLMELAQYLRKLELMLSSPHEIIADANSLDAAWKLF
ncbi:hypothetical protein DITRI_Ditri08aG0006700 [Diplodiscus trichospermus]